MQLGNKQAKRVLPPICIISSGEELSCNSRHLIRQLTLLPRYLRVMVQIREKELDTQKLLALAMEARAVDVAEGTLIIVNERLDIALAASLDGVHLPESACPADKLRPISPNMLFGSSVHSLEALHNAEDAGADYLMFSPIFDTPSKRKYGAPQGLEKLGEICRSTKLPVFALGGITPENAALCMDEGAYGIAALSIFQNAERFVETLEKFHRIVSP